MWASPTEGGVLRSPSSASQRSSSSVPSSPSAHATPPPPSAQLRRRQAAQHRRICLFDASVRATPVSPPPPPVEQHSTSLQQQDEEQTPVTIIHARSRHAEGRARTRTHALLPPPLHLSSSPSRQQHARTSRPGADACVSDACCSPPASPRASSPPSPRGTQLTCLTQPHWSSRRRAQQQRLVTRRAVLQELPQGTHEHHMGGTTHTAAASEHAPSPSTPPPLHASSLTQQQIRDRGFVEAWICVRQQQPGGPAEVYEHSSPLDSATWARLQSTQQQPPKLMTVHDRSFHSCTEARGEWANFRVRLSRGFSAFEETTMFPNIVQLLGTPGPSHVFPGLSSSSSSSMHSPSLAPALAHHAPPPHAHTAAPAAPQTAHSTAHSTSMPTQHEASEDPHSRGVSAAAAAGGVVQRRCTNARSLGDLVQLLADPTETGVLAHLANTGRLLRDKPRRICRTWGCLKARWGEEALHSLGFTPRKVHQLLTMGVIEGLVWHDELRAAHHYRGPADVSAAALRAAGGSKRGMIRAAAPVSHTGSAAPGSSSSGRSSGRSKSSEGRSSRSNSERGSSEVQRHQLQSHTSSSSISGSSAEAAVAAEAEARFLEQLRAVNARASSQLRSTVLDLCLAS